MIPWCCSTPGGDAFNIVRWIYTTDFETWSESNTWRAIEESHRAFDPEMMYLTPPESWEKLLEDLGRVASCGESGTPTCAYTRQPCAVCKFHSSENCMSAMCADIASRIRKLRGES